MVQPPDSGHCAFWKTSRIAHKEKARRRKDTSLVRFAPLLLAGTVLFAAGVRVGGRSEPSQNRLAGYARPQSLQIPMTVQRGDSFWSLAKRYGDPHTYILDRVDTLARANHLSATSTLMPGQRIVVPVTNPIEAARLQQTLAKK
ncbi:MAG: LysM peptidoglycan-binding domain-containing protein [Cytophagales bacterium]|nr:LysM peptidoglycan-binding domain-containing protein [Armatimonadota bacterium]